MKIAILTSGTLPVPAVQGGAVENLVDFYLTYNEQHHLHDITVYSIWHPDVQRHQALLSTINHYQYIDASSMLGRLRKRLYGLRHHHDYYHYSIDFFLHESLCHIRRQSFDMIIIENRPGYVLQLPKTIETKVVCHLHNDFLNISTPKAKNIYCRTDSFICISNYIVNCVRTIDVNDHKCTTVYNGIDTFRFAQAHPIDRQSIGLDDDDFVVVYSGRLTADKGILPLLQAFHTLNEIPRLKLLIVGASSYGQDLRPTAFLKQLEETAHPFSRQVIFTGYVAYDQVPHYLKAADIAVVPSVWEEPLGLTAIEAMAAGLPLVTTRSGGIPESCECVATIVERTNLPERLANAILDLYQHPEKREQMSKAAIERSKHFSMERYCRDFFQALEDIHNT